MILKNIKKKISNLEKKIKELEIKVTEQNNITNEKKIENEKLNT